MFDKDKEKHEKLEAMIKLAETSDEELAKMNYKEKQQVFKAKNGLCRIVWKSGEKGTYKKPKKEVTK